MAGGAFLFPSSRGDLALGEFWQVNGCTHGMGAEGSQSFAYDMGVWGPNHDDGIYSWLQPGKNGTQNSHFRIWGKPVHEIAAGVVLEAINDCPDNPAPLTLNSDKAHNDKQWADQQKNYWGAYETAHGGAGKVHAGAGNHFYIQHGDEVVLYAHMQKDSLNNKLLIPGAQVTAGDVLGLAGNAGNASALHLHIHAVKGTAPEIGPLRPFILRDSWAIDNDFVISDPRKGIWSPIAGQGIPEGDQTWNKKDCFIWPDKSLPEWPELVKLTVAETDYQSLFNTMHGNGFRPDWFDAFTVDIFPGLGQTFFNVIFRPATGVNYQPRHGLSSDQYQAEFDDWVKAKNYRLAHIESYYSYALNRVCYALIFVKSPGPVFTAYHGKSRQEHQTLFDDLTKNQGYVPVNISVVPVGGGGGSTLPSTKSATSALGSPDPR